MGETKEKLKEVFKKAEEVLFDGDEIVKIDGKFDISKYKFHRKELKVDEFLEQLEKYPSLGFNAYQRLYAALKMFGKTKSVNPFKPDKPRWLDYPIEGLPPEPGVGPVFGVEEQALDIMNYLRESCTDVDIRGRLLVLVGDVGTGKSNTIKLMERCLGAFGTLPQGEVYTIKFDLRSLYDEVREKASKAEGETLKKLKELNRKLMEDFGGLESILCPTHENPVNAIFVLENEGLIKEKKLMERIENINKNLRPWQKLEIRSQVCPSCEYTISKLRDIKEEYGELIDLSEEKIENEIIKIENLKPIGSGALVRSQTLPPPDERSAQRVDQIEGSVEMGRMIAFGGKRDHPLVLNFGLGGMIDGPSGQRAMIHLTEIYKADKEFIRSLLDFVQNKTLHIKGGLYHVYVDAVVIGSSNLDETRKILEYEIAKTIRSRSKIIPFGNLVVADDAAKAFSERIFKNVDYHVPPHFLTRLLPFLYVMSTLAETKVENLTLVEKALIYNNEYPHGRERDITGIINELKREAQAIDIDKIVEGMRIGISMRIIENLKTELGYTIRQLNTQLKERLQETPCIALLERAGGVKTFLEDFVKKSSDINDETRKRILEKVIPIIFDYNERHGLFYTNVAKDVHLALLGSEQILSTAATYLAMITALVKRETRYKTLDGYMQPIDTSFVDEIEKEMNLPQNAREAFVHKLIERIRERKSVYTQIGKEATEKEIYLEVVKNLLDEDRVFRNAIEGYAIRTYVSQRARDATSIYSPQNKLLVEELKKRGYCDYCAQWAIAIASNIRPKK